MRWKNRKWDVNSLDNLDTPREHLTQYCFDPLAKYPTPPPFPLKTVPWRPPFALYPSVSFCLSLIFSWPDLPPSLSVVFLTSSLSSHHHFSTPIPSHGPLLTSSQPATTDWKASARWFCLCVQIEMIILIAIWNVPLYKRWHIAVKQPKRKVALRFCSQCSFLLVFLFWTCFKRFSLRDLANQSSS